VSHQRKDSADGRWLDDGAECFVVVNAETLSEAAENPAGFVSVQRAISMDFVFENPFTSDNIGLGGTGHEIPCVVG
jgi:hypothetical protein